MSTAKVSQNGKHQTSAETAKQLQNTVKQLKQENKKLKTVDHSRSSPHAQRATRKVMKHAPAALLNSSASACIARAVTLPLNYSCRLPDPWNERETAVVNPFTVRSKDWSLPKPNFDTWGPGSALFGVSRDPLNHTVETYSNVDGTTWSYGMQMITTKRTPDYEFTVAQGLVLWPGPARTFKLKPAYLQHLAGPPVYGTRCYAMEDNLDDPSNVYHWIDGRSDRVTTIAISYFTDESKTTPVALAADEQAYFLELFQLGSDSPVSRTAFGASPAEIYIDRSNYYRFEITQNATTATVDNFFVAFDVSGSCSTYKHSPMEGLEDRSADVEAIRFLGVAGMVSPSSTEWAKGGTAVALQLTEATLPSAYYPYDPNVSMIDMFLYQRHAKKEDFNEGIYGWHKPTAEEDYEMQEPFEYNTTLASSGLSTAAPKQVIGFRAKLYPPGGWLLFAIQTAPNPNGGIDYPGASALFTISQSAELDTNSPWYVVAAASTEGSLSEVNVILRDVPQVTKNHFHWRDLTDWISKNADVLKKTAMAGLTGLVGATVPEALPVVAAASKLI